MSKYYKIIFYILLLYASLISSCKDKVQITPEIETGTLIDDRDSGAVVIYKTVKIGNQWWMAENLKAKKFTNGKIIAEAKLSEDWQKDKAAYCLYDNNSSAPGLLYNFYAVTDSAELAPKGWHIPSDDEWKELEIYLGMNSDDANKTSWRGTHEGEKLKAEGETWNLYKNVWGTNESGFTALAGGCRLFDGTWGTPGMKQAGFWWSHTTHKQEAWYRHLDYKNANIFRYYGSKKYGFSVRCIKD